MEFRHEYTEIQPSISYIQIYQDQILLQNAATHAAPEEGSMVKWEKN